MNPRHFIAFIKDNFLSAKKPDKDEYSQHLRLVLLGIAGVGAIGFTIQFVFSVITFGR